MRIRRWQRTRVFRLFRSREFSIAMDTDPSMEGSLRLL
jgi:hypothetical protein